MAIVEIVDTLLFINPGDQVAKRTPHEMTGIFRKLGEISAERLGFNAQEVSLPEDAPRAMVPEQEIQIQTEVGAN